VISPCPVLLCSSGTVVGFKDARTPITVQCTVPGLAIIPNKVFQLDRDRHSPFVWFFLKSRFSASSISVCFSKLRRPKNKKSEKERFVRKETRHRLTMNVLSVLIASLCSACYTAACCLHFDIFFSTTNLPLQLQC
jgi:hypothetical protein